MSKRLLFAAFSAVSLMSLTSAPTAQAVLPATHSSSVSIARSHAADNLARAIARKARQQALEMCSVGLCYRGVKRALSALGIELAGNAAWMAKDQLAKDKRFKMVALKDLSPGDILVHGRSRAHPYGHIAVYLGNGQEASDHVQRLVLGGRYGNTVVFRARHPYGASQTMVALSKR